MTTSPRLEPVLVAVADVAASEPALQYAAAEALRDRRPVQVVHVVTDEASPSSDAQLRGAADRVHELTHGQVPIEAVAHAAPLLPALVTLSQDAALVVLQRRPRTRLQSLRERSVSTHVAGQAHVPTVWVPEDWRRCESCQPQVVVGVDAADSDESINLLRHGLLRAAERGATLTVVHAWQLTSGYDDAVIDPLVVDDWANRYQEALHSRLSTLRTEYPQVDVEVEIVHRLPADALVQAGQDAALLVLARGRLAHPLVGHLGSVARAVMRSTRCPVEIIPDPRRS